MDNTFRDLGKAAAAARGQWLADKERWENTFEVRVYTQGGFSSTFSLTIEQARIDRDVAVKLTQWYGKFIRKVEILDCNCKVVERGVA